MQTGKVYLVGAGPADVGLLTLRGKELIERADVVVYDALVGQAVLGLIPESTRRIDVGKRAGEHPVPQQRINMILLEEALSGSQVVRLKGGELSIRYTDEAVLMTGEAKKVFEGMVEI